MGRRARFIASLLALAALVALVVFIGTPSEVSTPILLVLLLLMIALTGLIISLAARFTRHEYQRLAAAGVGLLMVGTGLAFRLLPEHEATRTSQGAIGVLPPAPGTPSEGFQVGLETEPKSCDESVPIKLVVNGSPGYWSRFRARYHPAPGRWLHFVIVLPGEFSHLHTGLGRENTHPTDDPQTANIIHELRVEEELHETKPVRPGKRELTVLSGEVKDWAHYQRPVIVMANAHWITPRGINDCTLHLPALSGSASALVLAEALTCNHLNESYLRGTCSDPPGPAGETPSATVSPALEISEAATMVTGSDVSKPESVPQPMEVHDNPGWRCHAPTPSPTPTITGGSEAGSGAAPASILYQSDCHAVATLVASSWRRDFLLALIGALLAVGVHMIFQATVEASGDRREHAADARAGAGMDGA
jgi:hypothetical protein